MQIKKIDNDLNWDTDDPNLNVLINLVKEKYAQQLKEKNLDLVVENDNGAASPVLLFSLYERNKGLNFTNSED